MSDDRCIICNKKISLDESEKYGNACMGCYYDDDDSCIPMQYVYPDEDMFLEMENLDGEEL